MSFFHYCAVGNFDEDSLSIGEPLRLVSALPRHEVEGLAIARLGSEALEGPRPALRWMDQGYVVINYIALVVRPERASLARELAARFGATIVDVIGGEIVNGAPWPHEQ